MESQTYNEIHENIVQMLAEDYPSSATVKMWAADFK